MSKIYKVINKNSNVLIEGQPKLPTAEQLEPAEIAVNYAASGETLSIKNIIRKKTNAFQCIFWYKKK